MDLELPGKSPSPIWFQILLGLGWGWAQGVLGLRVWGQGLTNFGRPPALAITNRIRIFFPRVSNLKFLIAATVRGKNSGIYCSKRFEKQNKRSKRIYRERNDFCKKCGNMQKKDKTKSKIKAIKKPSGYKKPSASVYPSFPVSKIQSKAPAYSKTIRKNNVQLGPFATLLRDLIKANTFVD